MKKFKILILLILIPTLLTGCFKRDSMENIKIYTTTYPIEYLVNYLYGYNSEIKSIYPKGVKTDEYTLTSKKIREYSRTDMFIYNGLTKEKNLAATFLNRNRNIKIIDVAKGLNIQRDPEELWLSPSNYLMLAQNIKNSLTEEYVKSTIVKQEIETNYDNLKLIISKYDAELKLIAESAGNKDIVVGNDIFKFLEKYGFNVISVEENDYYQPTDYTSALERIQNKTNTYVFILSTDQINENTKNLESAGATIVKVHAMTNLTDQEDKEGQDYRSLMESFIESIKTEVYN